ncbi:zinc finger protein 804A isoform X2 [Brachyhypopomus gauderio]|uniref:zinc finger protein 804A isoform X2 n=1 Tax=Brachyhypopomus gauderio TaxID=698409 RepID=UPI0040425B6D
MWNGLSPLLGVLLSWKEKEKTLAKALEDLRANFYCQLCDKQYYKHQEFDNHISSYDHAHKQRLKDLKQREFARNVSSRSRKDVRREERALLRLHQLAEQRREAQSAPGSGPMFRSTTVAVESSCRDACCPAACGEVLPVARQDTQPTGGSSCPASKQTPWPHGGKSKKQTLRRKVAFSFSFPKKACVKLESSAAVFSECPDEGPSAGARRSQTTRTPELHLTNCPTRESNGEVELQDREEACSCSGAQHEGQTRDQYPHQAPDQSPDQSPHQSPDQSPHQSPDQSPDPSEVWSQGSLETSRGGTDLHASPDLCAFLVYAEDMPVSPHSPCGPHIVLNLENSVENVTEKTTVKATIETAVETTLETTMSEHSSSVSQDKEPPLNTSDPSPGSGPEEHWSARAQTAFTTPLPPFVAVLGRDSRTIFQWPSEMVSFTTTEPSLGFSCNPLHFDFRGSQVRRGPNVQDGKPNPPPGTDEAPSSHGTEGAGQRSHRYHEDSDSCERQRKPSRGRRSRRRTHTRKRTEDKGRATDHRHYRSRHKKRQKRSRWRRSEDGGQADQSPTQKRMKFHRQAKSREGLDSQFRGATSQQEQPLQKSKQSTPNQAANRSVSPAVDGELGSSRQEASGSVSGSAGNSDESCHRTVLRNSGETAPRPAAGEGAVTGPALTPTPPHMCHTGRPTPWPQRDGALWNRQGQKRRHRDSQGREGSCDEVRCVCQVPCKTGREPDGSTEDDGLEDEKCCSTHGGKRPKLINQTSHLTTEHSEGENAVSLTTEHSEGENTVSITTEHSEGESAVFLTTEHSEGENTVSLTTEHSEGENTISLTTEHNEGENEVSLSTEHSEGENAVPLTTEHSEGENAISLTTEHSEGENTVSLTTEHSEGENAVSLTTEHNEGKNAISLTTEHNESENTVSLSTEHSEGENAVSLTTEHSEGENAVSLTTEHSEGENAVSLSTEHSEGENTVSLSTEHSEGENTVFLTTEHNEGDSAVSLTTEHSEGDSAVSLTTEHSEGDSAVSLTTEHSECENAVFSVEQRSQEESNAHCSLLKGEHDSSNGAEQTSCSIDDAVSSAADCQTPSVSGQTGVDNSCCQPDPHPAQINTPSRQGTEPQSSDTLTHAPPYLRMPGRGLAAPVRACQQCAATVQVPAMAEKDSYAKPGQPGQLCVSSLPEEDGPFYSRPRLQVHVASLERLRLLRARAHTHALHQQVFATKLKPVLPRLAIPVPSPVLHPVHVPPPMAPRTHHHPPRASPAPHHLPAPPASTLSSGGARHTPAPGA